MVSMSVNLRKHFMYEISIMCNLLAYKKDKNKMLDQMACKWLLWLAGMGRALLGVRMY